MRTFARLNWFPGVAAPCILCQNPGVRAVAISGSDVDLALINRIVGRDETAVGELYDRHSRVVYSVVLRILRSPSDAEEVLQEVFVRVWTRAETYDARLGSAVAWLLRIARNRAIDRLRSKRARGDVDVPGAEAPELEVVAVAGPAADPLVRAEGAATADAVRSALASLPDSQRVLIEAAFFDGYTHQELAARFGLPLGTVKTRIRTGLTAMRGRLEHLV
jgi:RNA polymerase sigma-70 factor (ECF subfamily)